MAVPRAIPGDTAQRPRQAGRQEAQTNLLDGAWAQLDSVDCYDLFLTKIPMLRSCPRFLRGRLRESLSFALREGSEARWWVMLAETRGWKLFDPNDVASQAGRSSLIEQKSAVMAGSWT